MQITNRRLTQDKWTAARKKACKFIIEKPHQTLKFYATSLDLSASYITECFEMLNMPVTLKPDHYVGIKERRKPDRYESQIKVLRSYAARNGIIFKRLRDPDYGNYLGWIFQDAHGRQTHPHKLNYWFDLFTVNSLHEEFKLAE